MSFELRNTGQTHFGELIVYLGSLEDFSIRLNKAHDLLA